MTRKILAALILLISIVYLNSCAASIKMRKDNEKQPQADSVDKFVPLHPPVIIPHTWREAQRTK